MNRSTESGDSRSGSSGLEPAAVETAGNQIHPARIEDIIIGRQMNRPEADVALSDAQ